MDSSLQPLVSIVVPVYNSAAYLEQCLDSVLAQTHPNWELILVDDGSTDESLQLLERYVAQDSRMHLYQQQHGGPGAARNFGIAKAHGEYLYCLDADDFIERDLLESAVKRARETQADIVIWDLWYFNERFQRKQHPPVGTLVFGNFDTKREVFNWRDNPDKIFTSFHNWVWNKLFRMDFVRREHLSFSEEVHRTEDLQFTGAALVKAERIAVIPRRLMCYRMNIPQSAMATKDRHPIDFLLAFLRFREYLMEQGLYEQLQKSFLNWTVFSCFCNLTTLHTYQGFCEAYDALKNGGLESLGAWEIPMEDYDDFGVPLDLEAIQTLSPQEFLFRRNWILQDAHDDAVAWIDYISMDKDDLEDRLHWLTDELETVKGALAASEEQLDRANRQLNATEQKVGQVICYVPRLMQRAILEYKAIRDEDYSSTSDSSPE